MRILIRCDGGPGVGVGHAVRSLALAEEALGRGHEVLLAGRLAGRLLDELVAEAGVHVVPEAPLDATGVAALAAGYDIVHVDHYDVADGVRAALASGVASGRSVPVLSTMVDGRYGAIDADLAVACVPEVHRDPPARWVLRGPAFIPMRRRVLGLRRPDAVPGDGPLRVVVVMGGVDPVGLAPSVVDALARAGVELDVVVVASDATRALLDERARQWGGRLTVVDPVADLPALAAGADLVVSAAGTSTWELAVLRTPMALVASVDNQRTGHDLMADAGAAVPLGGPDDVRDLEGTAGRLRPVLREPSARAALADAASRVVDGLGAWRVVSAWEAIAGGAQPGPAADDLTIRPATVEDARLLHDWRDDPMTRAMSRSSEHVSWADHVAWLTTSLSREDRLLLVAEDEVGGRRRPVGTVRWDREGPREWEVSITVAPDRRREGLSVPLLHAGERDLMDRVGGGGRGPMTFLAVVHEHNPASLRLFTASGYLPHDPADGAGFLRLAKSRAG